MTQPKDLTSTKADLDRSPRTKKLLQAKEVLKKRHRKIRPQTDLRSIE